MGKVFASNIKVLSLVIFQIQYLTSNSTFYFVAKQQNMKTEHHNTEKQYCLQSAESMRKFVFISEIILDLIVKYTKDER